MMIYHTEWKERGLKGLWVDAAASGTALLVLSATNGGVFVVLLSWLACSVLNRIFCKSLGEVFFPEEESEVWSKIFPMLWPKGLPGDTRQSLLLSRIKWLVNPASWTLSFVSLLEWSLLKAVSFLRQKRVLGKVDLGLLFFLKIGQTLLRGVSLLVEGAENLFSGLYWIGYGLSYVFGFRPPPSPRGDEMVPWDPRVDRNKACPKAGEAQPLIVCLSPRVDLMQASEPVVYKLIMEQDEGALAEVKEAQPPPGLYLGFHELSKYDSTPLGKNGQGYHQIKIRYGGRTLLYQMEPLFCKVEGFRLRAEDWATSRQIGDWYKAHGVKHDRLQIKYIQDQRIADRAQIAKMATEMAADQAKMAEKWAKEKKTRAEETELDVLEKEEGMEGKNVSPAFLRSLQRLRETASDAKQEATKAQQEAKEAYQKAREAQEAADEARSAFERQYPSERKRRGSGQEFFSHEEGSGRKSSAAAQEDSEGNTPRG